MLTELYSIDFLRRNLLPADRWKPFPPASDRGAWENLCRHELNAVRRDFLVGQAGEILKSDWPNLPATLYLDVYHTDNRMRYQRPYYLRRQRLAVLTLAECMEHRGRFVDAIADAVWSICEESTWCIPAHTDGLPSPEARPVDLFACETAMAVAEAVYLMRAELDAVSPSIVKRARHEVMRQVVEPAGSRDDFFWLAGNNNWTPWCCSNALGAAMYVLDDPKELAGLVFKLMAAVDRFIGKYGAEGGCEEGPLYWGVAAGAMLMFLELLYDRSEGKISIYDQPKIAAMGRYIADFHIDGQWFASFADAQPRPSVRRQIVYRYGERTGCKEMTELALASMRNWKPAGPVEPPLEGGFCGGDMMYMLRELFWIPADAAPAGIVRPLSRWYGDIQTMIARQNPADNCGLVLAAKAGHNNVSHNHNDIGQFIIYLDGQPVIIDTGTEEYVRSTFGPKRYEFWYTRGSGHNVPLIGGIEQQAGREFEATDVQFADTAELCSLTMQLAAAYPKNAHLANLRREIVLDRLAGRIVVRDSFEFDDETPRTIEIPLLSPSAVELKLPGIVVFKLASRNAILKFDPAMLDIDVQEFALNDDLMRKAWGPKFNKLSLRTRSARTSGVYDFIFQAGD